MAELSGWVVVLVAPGGPGAAIKDIRNLGSNPVAVKPNLVIPVAEVKPTLSTGQEYGIPTITHDGITATRTWPVVTSKLPSDFDQDALNAELTAEGSIVRGLALVLLDEVNALRTQAGLPTRTVAQLKNAIRAKMR